MLIKYSVNRGIFVLEINSENYIKMHNFEIKTFTKCFWIVLQQNNINAHTYIND